MAARRRPVDATDDSRKPQTVLGAVRRRWSAHDEQLLLRPDAELDAGFASGDPVDEQVAVLLQRLDGRTGGEVELTGERAVVEALALQRLLEALDVDRLGLVADRLRGDRAVGGELGREPQPDPVSTPSAATPR